MLNLSNYKSAMHFQWIKSPSSEELTTLTHTIATRIGRFLARRGLLTRETEQIYLNSSATDDDSNPMHQLHETSITYRVAVGPRMGRKVFTLQTLPASQVGEWAGIVDGFSLHGGVA